MTIKEELQKLHEPDIWSLLLFVLFKIKDIPEYSGISELAYILDRKNLLKLCEYFGGTTITMPTIPTAWPRISQSPLGRSNTVAKVNSRPL